MEFNGVVASEGIITGKAYVVEDSSFNISDHKIENPSIEMAKLNTAIDLSVNEIKALKLNYIHNTSEENDMIFDAHVQIARDPEVIKQVNDLVFQEFLNCANAYNTVINLYIKRFEKLDDQYMRERAVDVKDVSRRVMSHLSQLKMRDLSLIKEKVILVSNDLTPSDITQLNKNYVKGVITNKGGTTSHSAIMLRSLDIPAIFGIPNIMEKVSTGDVIILDGLNGEVIIKPEDNEVFIYDKMIKEYNVKKEEYKKYINLPSKTVDGKLIEIAANIVSSKDLDLVIKNGAEGVGLFRTEFIYMNRENLPSEEEQYSSYEKVLGRLKNQKVIIRTLDIGGDKHLDYFSFKNELDTVPTHRGIKLSLGNLSIFKIQIRALLQANKYGNLHIMFPMVEEIDDLRNAKILVKECYRQLLIEGKKVHPKYKIGMMIETLLAVTYIDQFAKEVDFFSIGTNDLSEALFGTNRTDEKQGNLYQPYHPILLKVIKTVIDASHKVGIWTGLCGEMAGDLISAPILLGLGIDELSMDSSKILKIKQLFNIIDYSEMKNMANITLSLKSTNEIKVYVENHIKTAVGINIFINKKE